MTKAATFVPPNVGQELGHASEFFASLQSDAAGFERLAQRLKTLAGIHLPTNPKNLSLMASRLAMVLRRRGLSGYRDYDRLLAANEPGVAQEFIEALTTNTTHFFREDRHFELLHEALLQLVEEKRKAHVNELRLWCSASSTGQEPYSIAMQLLETLPGLHQSLGWQVKMLATDIDREVLGHAAAGVYTEAEVQSVPAALRQKYFAATTDGRYLARADLRNMIRFAPLNLTQPSYPFQHKFDVVFCRNVLIYFERDMAAQVVRNLCHALGPGGYLFIGHSETGVPRPEGMIPAGAALWRKAGVP